jgi:DNA-binding NtrC family response regulator
LGGTKTLQTDARLIAATQHDLRQKVAKGTFREDLFYRLYVIPIHLPPLRERQEDVPELAQYFLERFSRRNHKRFTGIHPAALKMLSGHAWPGNVRQLENEMERAVALYDDTILLPEYLQLEGEDEFPRAQDPAARPGAAGEKLTARDSLKDLEKQMILDTLKQSRYKVGDAAKAMGVSRATFYRKMAKYGIEEGELSKSQN